MPSTTGRSGDGAVGADLERAGFGWLGDAAELVVVDELLDLVRAADGAVGIFAELDGAEAHAERVDQQQAADEGLADA